MDIESSLLEMFTAGGAPLYVSVFVVGLIYGLTTCTFSCLPVVGSYLVGTGRSFSQGVKDTFVFSIAKIIGYTAMGVCCGLAGNIVSTWLTSPMVMVLCGSAMVVIGGFLLFSKQKRSCCTKNNCFESNGKKPEKSIYLISLGLVMSLIPCLPYTAIMMAATASGSALLGGSTAFMFGLGTTFSPLLLLGGATAWLGKRISEQIPAHTHIIRKTGAIMISLMGSRVLLSVL